MSGERLIEGSLFIEVRQYLKWLPKAWELITVRLSNCGRGLQIHYFHGDEETGTIYLEDCRSIIKKRKYAGKENVIALSTKDNQTYHMCARTKEEMDQWYKTIDRILSCSYKDDRIESEPADRKDTAESGYASIASGDGGAAGGAAGGQGTENSIEDRGVEHSWETSSSSDSNTDDDLLEEDTRPVQESEPQETEKGNGKF